MTETVEQTARHDRASGSPELERATVTENWASMTENWRKLEATVGAPSAVEKAWADLQAAIHVHTRDGHVLKRNDCPVCAKEGGTA